MALDKHLICVSTITAALSLCGATVVIAAAPSHHSGGLHQTPSQEGWGNSPNFYTAPSGQTTSRAASTRDNASPYNSAPIKTVQSSLHHSAPRQVSRSTAGEGSISSSQAQAANTITIPQARSTWTNPDTHTAQSSYRSEPPAYVASASAQANSLSRYTPGESIGTNVSNPGSVLTPNTYVTANSRSPYLGSAVNTSAVSARTPQKSSLLTRLLPGRKGGSNAVVPVSNKPCRNLGQTQDGMASWYGKDFDGGETANGETYRMDSMTAAHKSLPFGTLVKVQNLDNGRSCTVRINNRGPYIKNRVLDLSKAAASQLGFISRGITHIRMEVIGRV